MQSVLRLTEDALRRIWPGAPSVIIQAFVDKQHLLAKAGVLDSPMRLAYFAANLAHESGGWRIKNLTENTGYTHARVAQVWPNRYSSATAVLNAFGSQPGWQNKLFDVIYGNRMGNRPGTHDGSKYIGRGGPQITGRDGYRIVGQMAGLPLEDNPVLATLPEHQPAIAVAFWSWKKLNGPADASDFRTVVVRWNGGTNGMADRLHHLARILPITKALSRGPVTQSGPVVRSPEAPATPVAPSVPKGSVPGTIGTLWASISYYFDVALPIIGGVLVAGVVAYVAWLVYQNRRNK